MSKKRNRHHQPPRPSTPSVPTVATDQGPATVPGASPEATPSIEPSTPNATSESPSPATGTEPPPTSEPTNGVDPGLAEATADASEKHTPPVSGEPTSEDQVKLPSFEFEFEILNGERKVVDTKKLQANARTEGAAMDMAVSMLTLEEGQSYRYTGRFTKHIN